MSLSLSGTFFTPTKTHCVRLHTCPRGTGSLIISLEHCSCAAEQQLKNPSNFSSLTSDRAPIALTLGSLETTGSQPLSK